MLRLECCIHISSLSRLCQNFQKMKKNVENYSLFFFFIFFFLALASHAIYDVCYIFIRATPGEICIGLISGLPRLGKNIWKMKFFPGQEKSGNFVDGQGNLERT